jgi:hypothetical protein
MSLELGMQHCEPNSLFPRDDPKLRHSHSVSSRSALHV